MPKEPFLFLGSCNLRGTKLRGERKEFGPVVSLAMFEHAEDGVQELPHRSDQSLEFRFALDEQMLIERAQMRIVPDGDEGGI